MKTKLTDLQQIALDSLKRHGAWHPNCGWILTNESTTVRTLKALVKKGLVSLDASGLQDSYSIKTAAPTYIKATSISHNDHGNFQINYSGEKSQCIAEFKAWGKAHGMDWGKLIDIATAEIIAIYPE